MAADFVPIFDPIFMLVFRRKSIWVYLDGYELVVQPSGKCFSTTQNLFRGVFMSVKFIHQPHRGWSSKDDPKIFRKRERRKSRKKKKWNYPEWLKNAYRRTKIAKKRIDAKKHNFQSFYLISNTIEKKYIFEIFWTFFLLRAVTIIFGLFVRP